MKFMKYFCTIEFSADLTVIKQGNNQISWVQFKICLPQLSKCEYFDTLYYIYDGNKMRKLPIFAYVWIYRTMQSFFKMQA